MKKISSRNYLIGLRVHLLPVVVWFATLVCVVVLFSHRSQRFEVVGMAWVEVHEVAATARGRLKSVPVQLFDTVDAGDTVAVLNTVLDDEHIQKQIATIDAQKVALELQLTELRQNYEAEIHSRESEWVAERRAFTADVVAAEVRVLDVNAVLESDRALLATMQADVRTFTIRNQARLGTDSGIYYELQTMKANYDTLAKKIEENENLRREYMRKLDEAIARRQEFHEYKPRKGTPRDASDVDPNVPNAVYAVDVIAKAIEALERQKEELQERLKDVLLKAEFGGVVSQIDNREGEAVLAGEPILTIRPTKPTEILAYASQDQAGLFEKDVVVEVIKRAQPPQIAENAHVTYVGPAIEQIPTRLWRNPAIPEWGRPIRITIPPGLDLIPGEVVGIRVM
ncbi:MAG: HlyD family efflux transporter periplasmic adaptor subunit [Planctomycetes bacterium]|nr:HlyD family efflux transporter periplasmic adaptor subunit [Planctomycetota bacterium]